MVEIPGIYFFFLPALSLSCSTGGRGREGRASNRAQGRPGASALSAHVGAASVSSPLSLSSLPLAPSLTASPLQPHPSRLPLPPLHAPKRAPGAPPPTLRRGPRSARAVPRPPCLRDLRAWERLPAPPGRFVSPLLLLFRGSFAAGGGRPAAAPPTPCPRVLRRWAPPALPNSVPPPLGNRFLRG